MRIYYFCREVVMYRSMNRNSFFDKWMSLSRGQRRATIVLVAVIVVLAGAQAGVCLYRQNREVVTTDYSAIEQEIVSFRARLDSVPAAKSSRKYVRHKRVVRDSVPLNNSEKLQPIESQPMIRPVPRIGR